MADPLAHYLSGQGYGPHPLFDETRYIATYGEELAGVNALVDFVTVGHREGRSAHPLFDPRWYADQCGADLPMHANALEHYVLDGWRRGRDPHPLFSVSYYLDQNPDVAALGVDPLSHYLHRGWREQRNPHPLFPVRDYLEANPDVAAAGVDPLYHFCTGGWREGREAHPLFASKWYRSRYPDVEATDQNPILHYLKHGAAQGKDPNPFFDTRYYQTQHEAQLQGENALIHYVTKGAHEERNPSRLFDREYYLAHNADVRETAQEPLSHFVSSGAAESRRPRAPSIDSDICEIRDVPIEVRRVPPPMKGKDACLFVTYSADGHVHDHVLYCLRSLKRQGLSITVVVTTDGLARPLPDEINQYSGLIVRGNHGWDFAAWAAGLTAIPDLWNARSLILANDSVYGPISDEALRKVMDRIRSSESDMVGLTDSYQVCHHVMSYFIGLTSTGLKSKTIRNFWNSVKSIKDKDKVIQTYELTRIDWWRELNVSVEVLFPTAQDQSLPINPTLAGWWTLIQRGHPFLKVQLLRDNLSNSEPTGWRAITAENHELRAAIESHLRLVWAPKNSPVRRPVPAPKRRFQRRSGLSTFYGATPSTRPTGETDLAIGVPFGFDSRIANWTKPIAVVAHIFYPDLADQLQTHIGKIPVPADIFITTDTLDKKSAIEKTFENYANGAVDVRITPNRGRDIAAMLVGCRDVFERYDYFLHVHSKKSRHDPRFRPWRDFLLDNLVGSPETVWSILRLLQLGDVGVVFSQHFEEVRPLLNWGYDYDLAKSLLRRCGVNLSKDLVLDFPSSSFFWARSSAISPMLDLNLSWNDFPPEEGQIDGTFAHAIERSLLYVAEASGHSWVKVANADDAPGTTVPVLALTEIEPSLARVYRPLLGNRIAPLRDRELFPEVTPVMTRPDHSGRPRLNLVLPSLHPAHTFGGITTAIRIFEEIAAACGEQFDLRILCGLSSVDMEAMLPRPEYVLIPLGSPYDAARRTIVDLTDHGSGELPIRQHDVFVATAWWTAAQSESLRSAQTRYHGRSHPLVYLIQDHEPGFYPWSDRFGEAQATYARPDTTMALINSEELAAFVQQRYAFPNASVVRYKPNPSIRAALRPLPRERIILIYGRPSVSRNCFDTICRGLHLWQQSEPTLARQWRIVSAGEDFPLHRAGSLQNLEVCGKLDLEGYADLLSRASVGVSLMLSPHPSYPPLEMAHAGLRTITNTYANKDLGRRSPNIVSLSSVTPDALEEKLMEVMPAAERDIGTIASRQEIETIACEVPEYDAAHVAQEIIRNIDRT